MESKDIFEQSTVDRSDTYRLYLLLLVTFIGMAGLVMIGLGLIFTTTAFSDPGIKIVVISIFTWLAITQLR